VSLLLPSIDLLAQRLGLPADSELLATALTHSSFAAEHSVESNERLEFLGDAVVDLVVADAIITQHPELDQGTGSLARSRVVNEASLARAAARLQLGDFVRLGRGERKSHGEGRPSLLADAFEAVVAAIYLERGFLAARTFVLEHLAETLAEAAASPEDVDPKSRLRQWSEGRGSGLPVYEVIADGPSHAMTFAATVRVGGLVLGAGRGRSKKAAELDAARAAWEARPGA
jgi:ribonuclease-3